MFRTIRIASLLMGFVAVFIAMMGHMFAGWPVNGMLIALLFGFIAFAAFVTEGCD
jgi:hypothetical protein|tara:strand:+ start:382 stop:546 length:165 start_codon:yes stop_codon:yes gene_type:complete